VKAVDMGVFMRIGIAGMFCIAVEGLLFYSQNLANSGGNPYMSLYYFTPQPLGYAPPPWHD
jgi:hypothetical protein